MESPRKTASLQHRAAWLGEPDRSAEAPGVGAARARPGLPKAEAGRWRRPAPPRSGAALIRYGSIRQ